jgi:hypothetical protein
MVVGPDHYCFIAAEPIDILCGVFHSGPLYLYFVLAIVEQ